MVRMMRLVVAVLGMALLGLTGCNRAHNTWKEVGSTPDGKGFLIRTLNNEGRQRQYAVFIPEDLYAGEEVSGDRVPARHRRGGERPNERAVAGGAGTCLWRTTRRRGIFRSS